MKKNLRTAIAALVIAALVFTMAFPLSAFALGGGTAMRDEQIWDGSVAASFAGGSGTEADPYLISNGAELAYLAQQVMIASSFSGKFFELTDDIWLNDTSNIEYWSPIYEEWMESPNQWNPIGNKLINKPFSGNFNGNGHTVYGLYTMQNGGVRGLFGYIRGANISNVRTAQSRVYGFNFCAGIIGYAENSSITDCVNGSYVKAMREDSYSTAIGSGGIVGYAEGSTIERCGNTGLNDSFGTNGVGGIAGKLTDCVVLNCENQGMFDCYTCSYVGGIAGDVRYGEIEGCANYCAEAEGAQMLFSGIAGSVIDGTVIECVNHADFGTAGSGIIGNCSAIVSDCENLGSIICENGNAAGIAHSVNKQGSVEPRIENCRNRGSIKGVDYAAGIAANAYGTVINCENYAEIVCLDNPYSGSSGGGICAYAAGTVEGCTNYGAVRAADGFSIYAGGIAGISSYSSLIINCRNYADISCSQDNGIAAGIVAYANNNVQGCVNYGAVSGCMAGGVAGEIVGGSNTVSECANHGSITGSVAGGIACENMYFIYRCYNTGSVNGFLTGGIACYNTYFGAEIADCYNTGSVTGIEGAGGIAGVFSMDANINRCYNIGEVVGEIDSGAIFALLDSDEYAVTSCYYLEGCCENAGEAGEALSSNELAAQESYQGFDFENVWTMAGDPDYPYAELISVPHESSGENPPPAPIMGDVDGNGTVNIADAILTLRLALGLVDGSGLQVENADANGDGSVSVADAILILRIALGL